MKKWIKDDFVLIDGCLAQVKRFNNKGCIVEMCDGSKKQIIFSDMKKHENLTLKER